MAKGAALPFAAAAAALDEYAACARQLGFALSPPLVGGEEDADKEERRRKAGEFRGGFKDCEMNLVGVKRAARRARLRAFLDLPLNACLVTAEEISEQLFGFRHLLDSCSGLGVEEASGFSKRVAALLHALDRSANALRCADRVRANSDVAKHVVKGSRKRRRDEECVTTGVAEGAEEELDQGEEEEKGKEEEGEEDEGEEEEGEEEGGDLEGKEDLEGLGEEEDLGEESEDDEFGDEEDLGEESEDDEFGDEFGEEEEGYAEEESRDDVDEWTEQSRDDNTNRRQRT